MEGRIRWAVSTPILVEYEEVIRRLESPASWHDFALLLDLIALTQGSLIHINTHFQFQVIVIDPDDNAFCDCAIAAHADYVITDDRHFAPLTGAGYKPQPISPLEFIERYRGVHV